MSAPILEVSTRGQTRYIPGDPQPMPQTALSRIDPDQVVRSAIEAQSSAVQSYLRAIGPAAQRTVDQAAQRAPTGYSNADELRHRNRRYYFTVAAYVAISAIVSYGLIWLATMADITPSDWFWPLFMLLAGALAMTLVRWTHSMESTLTPEGIELERVRSDGYATERAADGQHAIALAVAQAIGWRAESEFADSQARQLATESMYSQMRTPAPTPQRQLPDNRRFAVQWQSEAESGDMVYATSLPIAAHGEAEPSPRRIVCTAPAPPDSGCLAMLDAAGKLFDDCAQRGDNLIVTRLPWSQRGEWNAEMKRLALDVLARLDPPLLLAGDGGRWRLNSGAWCKPLALSAIRRRWPH